MAERRPVTYDEASSYLRGTINETASRSNPNRLDRMRLLLRELGDPQTRYPTVHVGGTSGKGSTSTMIAAALTAAGRRAGLHTKPHLRFDDRARANRRRADFRGSFRRAALRDDAGYRTHRARGRPALVLRNAAGARVRVFRTRVGRHRRDRGRHRRLAGRHQRLAAGRFGHHQRRTGSHRDPRGHQRSDRARQSRHRQARRSARVRRERRPARRHRGDLPRGGRPLLCGIRRGRARRPSERTVWPVVRRDDATRAVRPVAADPGRLSAAQRGDGDRRAGVAARRPAPADRCGRARFRDLGDPGANGVLPGISERRLRRRAQRRQGAGAGRRAARDVSAKAIRLRRRDRREQRRYGRPQAVARVTGLVRLHRVRNARPLVGPSLDAGQRRTKPGPLGARDRRPGRGALAWLAATPTGRAWSW